MKWKKVLSLTLAFSMVAGTFLSAAPAMEAEAAETESNTGEGYTDPWTNTQIPEIESKKDDDVDEQKFTHKEWTGETYEDLDGNSVKAADVYGINREEASSFATTNVVYDTVDKAITGAVDYKKEESNYVQFLTGEDESVTDWSLVVLQNQELAQGEDYADFYKTDYVEDTTKEWKQNLQLPGRWEKDGFDFSIYTNTQMPWQSKYDSNVTVPLAPTNYNPVGLYRKTFDVEDGLLDADGRVYISFQGVESSYYVYVNGKEVGYSEDTYSSHSFDITDYLTENGKDNLLAVEVHKFCDGTWMEDQDMYYDGGIFRDIYLYSAPLVHIQDYFVTTDLDENYENATLNLDVTVANASTQAASDYAVDVRLYDENKQMFVNDFTVDIGEVPAAVEGTDGAKSAKASKLVLSPELWSAETPNLYTMVLSLYNKETGAYMGSVSQQLGFREIEFTSSEVDSNGTRTTADEDFSTVTINGQPLLLKGANRHDTDPVYGKYIPEEVAEEDVKLMKQYNLNAIRTSHYSNDEYLYYLCDKYGLYMMGETNLESHAIMSNQSGHRNFKNLAMDRTVTAFKRLKNRTAIVIWSTGNENYYNYNKNSADGMFFDLIWYFKDNDPTRPVHSEGDNDQNGTDMGSNMYPSVSTVQGWAARNMPYVLCEYDHGMGNAVGNMKEYWDAIRSSDNMLGGFIWDWVDQARIISLDELPQSYQLTEKSSAAVTGSAKLNSEPNEVTDDKALTSKSIDGYALFDSDAYNQELSGSGKAFTVEVICKPASTAADKVLAAKGDQQFALKTNSSRQLEFFAYTNGNWNSVTAALPSDWVGNWHQVVAVYNQGNIKLYCDGVLLTEGTGNTTLDASSTSLGIGCSADNGRTFDGEISMGRIYTKALTLDEINGQNSKTPAIGQDSEDVLLWADFADIQVAEDDTYDYYAEETAHKNLYAEEIEGSFYGYGGDNGESPNDNSFCVNGLVSPDRDVQPELYEVKYQYQSVWFTATDVQLLGETVEVYNENNFLNLNNFEVVWSLLEDGKVIGEGTIADTDIAGRETDSISVPYLASMPEQKKAGAEYYLNLSVRLKENTLWAEKGHEVAYEQFQLPAEVEKVTKTISTNVQVDDSDADVIEVSGSSFSFQIDRATGTMKNYVYNGDVLLTEGPVPNYWRAPVNNDNGNYNGNWQSVNYNVSASDIQIGVNEEGQPTITVALASANQPNIKQEMKYTIDGSGAVTVNASVDATAVNFGTYNRFLRIGTVMELPEGYENVEWYGNGPVEAMWDREDFATVGRYSSTVTDMFYPYLDTQDTGTVTGVKWFTVTNPEKSGAMAIAALDTVEVSALHFTVDDLTQAQHPYELTKLDETILTVNYRSQGTGNASCGQDTLSAYTLPNNKEYSYEYTMIPYTTTESDAMDITRPYRTVASVSSDEILDAAAAELIEKIDAISFVTDQDMNDLKALKQAYEDLPEETKAQVSEERYEKVIEAIEFAEKAVITVEDKSVNGFDMDMSAVSNASLAQQADGSVAFKGFADVPGATETFGEVIGGTNSFTIEAEINPNGYGYGGSDYNMIASKGDNCTAFRISEQSVYFFIKNQNGSWITVQKALTDAQMNSWLHVAAIYNGNDISVYLEGTELTTTTGAGSITASTYNLGIGYCPETSRTSQNSIRNIRVYSRNLTKDELDQGSIGPNDESVVLWYDFDKYNCENIDMTPTGIRSYTKSLVLEKDKTAQVQASLIPYYAEGDIVYSSEDEEIATVDAAGVVTGVAVGNTSIKAAYGDEYVEIPVCVTGEIPITELTLAETAKTMDVGDTYAITTKILPEDTTDDTTLSYTSSNPAVASVEANGIVVAKAEGTATITVASVARPSVKASVSITVNKEASTPTTPITPTTPTAVTSVKFDSTKTVSVPLGSKITRKASLLPAGVSGTITYTSSNTKVATVDQAGVVKGKKVGTAKITATCNGKSATYSVKVVPKKVMLRSVVAKKNKTLTIKWKKASKVTGYEIQVSFKKNNWKGAKKYTVKKAKTVSKTIQLKTTKKKAYVRIRAYKKVGGKKYYSPYSAVKSKKIKK